MEQFSIEFRPLSAQAPLEGPIPLSLEITYNGDDDVTVIDADHMDISFDTPPGWKLKEISPLRQFSGRIPWVKLKKGESLSRTVYLHDYFTVITPGDVQLSVTVKIAMEGGDPNQPIILKDTAVLQIMNPDPKLFAERIDQIHSHLSQERSPQKRLELLRSIASLSHLKLIPILVQSILDEQILIFHSTARIRLVDLCETYGNREPVISYLVNSGKRYDGAFFNLWKQKKIGLSDEEIMRLSEAPSLWPRVFALENYKNQYNRHGLVESLKSEIEELSGRARELI